MLKRSILVLLLGMMVAAQFGCAAVAGGMAGAAIGHKAAERRDHHDNDRD
jgi:hypothetical protein